MSGTCTYCRDCLASSFSFRPMKLSCCRHWEASALVSPARAAEPQASDFWVSVSSVDELDLVHETSLQRRECSLSGVSFSCLNALPHPPKCAWFGAPPLQRCPYFADEPLDCRHRTDVLGRCCRCRTRKDASVAHCEEGPALGGGCEIGCRILASAACH